MLAAILFLSGTIGMSAQEMKGVDGQWSFTGKLTNSADTLYIIPTDNLKQLNEMVKTNGEFRFSTPLSQTNVYYVLTPSLIRNEPGGFSFFVTAVPGEVLVAEGFCDEEKPCAGLNFSGSKFYQYYNEATITSEKVVESENAQAALDFVKAHPDSESAVLLVSSVGCFSPDNLNELLSLMSPDLRNGRLKSYIDKEIAYSKEYLKQKELEGKSLSMGSMAPDFTLDDLSGNPLSLSSLRGKYLVLDFWGSWCGWCIKGFPKMKEYYAKYKDKMEILGVDCNDTVEKWKKAVSDNELPWKHVYVPRDSKLTSDYMITGFPTKIIISPEGNVLMTIIGEDPQFYEILDKLFSEN